MVLNLQKYVQAVCELASHLASVEFADVVAVELPEEEAVLLLSTAISLTVPPAPSPRKLPVIDRFT